MASETAVSIPFSVMSEVVLSCQAWELLGGLAEDFTNPLWVNGLFRQYKLWNSNFQVLIQKEIGNCSRLKR